MRLLLDTCTFLWITLESPELSVTARRLFEDPDNEVHLSAVSAWEIAIKSSRGKLSLPEPAARFLPSRRAAYHIDALPLDEESTLQLERLPRLHRDPFDRMLVCQSIVHGMAILTPDPLVSQYPARVIW